MASPPLTAVLRYVHMLAGAEARGDGELLERFVDSGDEAAFPALLERHGPLVWAVCRQVLHDTHDTEDAFQATFLVLARKASSIRRQHSLAAWLHRVALHIARRAKIGAARRQAHERQATLMAQAHLADEDNVRDWQPLLHEEIDRLPEKYRAPVVLCYLEGKTHDEAARHLGWPLGTVKGRLSRAREVLRTRLAGRGLALSAGGLALASAAAAPVPPALLGLTLQAALSFARGGAIPAGAASAQAVSLAKGAFQTMTAAKWALVLVLMCGVSMLTYSLLAGPPLPGQRGDSPPGRTVDRPGATDAQGDPLPPGAVARLGTVRFRHGAAVTTLVYFPDGKTVASGSADGTVRLWDAATGKELRRFPGLYVAVAPDGKTLASWGTRFNRGDKIQVWDVASGKQLHEFQRDVRTLVFAPDSKRLWAGGVDSENVNQLALWDLVTGKELPTPRMGGKYDYVYRLAFSPDGKTLATSGDDDDTVRFWDLSTGQELPRLGHNGQALAYSPSANIVALAGADKTDPKNWVPVLRLFDVTTRKELRQLWGLQGGVSSVTFSPNGTIVAAGGGDGVIRLWETATGKEWAALTGHCAAVTVLTFSPDGKTLASGSADHTLRLWEVASGQARHLSPGHQGGIAAVAVSADGKTVISASQDRTIRLWDPATGAEIRRLADREPIHKIALSPDGKTLASRSRGDLYPWGTGPKNEGVIRLWGLATGQELWQHRAEDNSSTVLAYSPDGRLLATGGTLDVSLRDAATGNVIAKVVVPQGQRSSGGVPFLAFSPDGKALAWSNNAYGRISETGTGKELQGLVFYRGENSLSSISRGSFAPDGQTLLLNVDEAICVWDVAERKEARRFQLEPRTYLNAMALSPDGKTLATGGGVPGTYRGDGTITLWEVATSKERLRLRGHQGYVAALAWSADGKVVVSGGGDTTVLVWKPHGGKEAPQGPVKLTDRELTSLWEDLAGDDAVKAYRAICALVAAPDQGVSLLRERLQPPAADPQGLARLLADLDNDQFAVREKATRELEQMGSLARPALRQVLAGQPSNEVRARASKLLEKLDQLILSGDALRTWRAIEVLEQVGTPAARQVLEKLAQGTPGVRLTEEARAALQRLAKRRAE